MIINTSDCKDIHVYSHRNPITEQLNISNRDEGGRPCRGVNQLQTWMKTDDRRSWKYYHPTPGFNPLISVYPSGGLPFLAAMTTHQDLTMKYEIRIWLGNRGPVVQSWSRGDRGPVVSQAGTWESMSSPRCHDLTPLYRLWLAHSWITAGPRTLIGRNRWPLNSGPRSGAGKIWTW